VAGRAAGIQGGMKVFGVIERAAMPHEASEIMLDAHPQLSIFSGINSK
jgi:hypothetical protein